MRTLSVLVAAMLTASVGGCGYRALRSDSVLGAHRIMVLPPREEVPTGIAGLLTEELSKRLASDGAHLVVDAERADATLSGVLVGSSTVPLATAAGATLSAFSVRTTLDVKLTDSGGDVLWQARFTEREDFLPPGGLDAQGILATESNRRRALSRLAERLAAQVQRSLMRAELQAEQAGPD